MAAKKTAKKKSTAGKKTTASKKTTAGKKTTASKKAAAKKKSTARKKAPAKKAASKKTAGSGKKAATSQPDVAEAKAESAGSGKGAAKKSGGFSSTDVNLGHVFALRPRVSTTFRQPDFLTARRRLEDESYESLEEATRAVAELALELTHDAPKNPRFNRGR